MSEAAPRTVPPPTVKKVWVISARILGIAPRKRKIDYCDTDIAEIPDLGESLTLEQVQGYFAKALEISKSYRQIQSLALTCAPNEMTTYYDSKEPVTIRTIALYSPRNQAWKFIGDQWFEVKR